MLVWHAYSEISHLAVCPVFEIGTVYDHNRDRLLIYHSLSGDFSNLQKVFSTPGLPVCREAFYEVYFIILPFSLFILTRY